MYQNQTIPKHDNADESSLFLIDVAASPSSLSLGQEEAMAAKKQKHPRIFCVAGSLLLVAAGRYNAGAAATAAATAAAATGSANARIGDDTLDHDPMSLRPRPLHPHMGHKLQLNTSSFTVNDYECLQLSTGLWPSERVHCELLPTTTNTDANEDTKKDDTAHYVIVVEHFDDSHCTKPNRINPTVHHTAAGCAFFCTIQSVLQ